MSQPATAPPASRSVAMRLLDGVEKLGNKLPDPAMLFLVLLGVVLVLSAWLSTISFEVVNPRTDMPVQITNLLAGSALTEFIANMVTVFTSFPPLGVVLVSMMGLAVAEHSGFINAGLRAMMSVTSKKLLTPMLIFVAILSHLAVDAGYVLVIPLGAVIFYAAGRHPLAGIAAAFAGVSGAYSASFLPTSLDPLLAGFTQAGAQIISPDHLVNPLNNAFFMAASSPLIIGLGWFITDRIVEPRLMRTAATIDGDMKEAPTLERLSPREKKGLVFGLVTIVAGLALIAFTAWPADSAWRHAESGDLTHNQAPLMRSIVPLILFLTLIPGVVYGMVVGTIKSHRDVVAGISKTMNTMGYYLVLAFCCAIFIAGFAQSNLGILVALEGAEALKASGLPLGAMLVGITFLTAAVNLLIGSASAKWGLLAPIFVPMLMQLGVSPDLTQAAYRIGDSSSNIITPLMPYFPLVVVFCQRYVKGTGIGTVIAMMLPYALTFLVVWSAFLLLYWSLGIPLGIGASFTYPAS
ncbi:AbgT family transporter [Silanimonas sp.]|uniref:AbgT family transporter n=1 Tax=Silanimonas sp. TaxID=1929290 RepID=UPI001BBBD725|nr:AbgT family transporter [Silanimonas sp.]MBS3896015.1 AbgT family transporter [Silanimonas sp.]MBS3924681.1 AbgT family transporter [Xanthomonadaceae bacterium]